MKKISLNEFSDDFDVTRQTASKWLAKFKFGGIAELFPKKSGPKKNHSPANKKPSLIGDLAVALAIETPYKGRLWIADIMQDEKIEIEQTTVYRILKERKVRYYQNYKHKRRKKKSYCLDRPEKELQLDCSFPWRYQKDAVIFDAIGDCSRWVFGKVYPEKKASSTILFLQELILRSPFSY